jgi:hypothetical protein
MLFKSGILVLTTTLAAGSAIAQQPSSIQKTPATGVIVSTAPHSALSQGPVAIPVQRPTASCESPSHGSSVVPEMVFLRMVDDLVCLHHNDGSSEFLFRGRMATVSSDGEEVAYWLEDNNEVHVLSTRTRSDQLIEKLAGGKPTAMIWSRKGRMLAYSIAEPKSMAIRSVDLDSGRRNTIQTQMIRLIESPDPEHVAIVSFNGVERIRILDSRRELVAQVISPDTASYSPSGELVGILASPPPASSPSAAPSANNDDDGPDCTGGTFSLKVHKTDTAQTFEIPFPHGFDNVLDFAFSPDDRDVAVTFGAAACDYPGEVARIYLVSLPDLKIRPISPPDHLSVKVEWTPDAKTLIYQDYNGSNSPLVAVNLSTGVVSRLTNPSDDGPDEWLAWRAGTPASLTSEQSRH